MPRDAESLKEVHARTRQQLRGQARELDVAVQALFVKTSLKLPRELWKRAHLRAMDDGVDLQTIVGRALEAYLAKGGKK